MNGPVSGEVLDIRRLALALKENLVQCADDPGVDPVHDTRTGTRRLQATLENLVRETPETEAGEPVRVAATALMRQLKRIRRAAGTVRDLDVHRKLVAKHTRRALGVAGRNEDASAAGEEAQKTIADQPDILEMPEAGLRTTPLEQQADDLDVWLKHRRAEQAVALRAQATGLMAKLTKRLAALEEALQGGPRRRRTQLPARLALDSFARLATEMQLLDAGNLHDFRKGAKKARYVAELAEQADVYAGQVGKTLKRLQDEIGDWHDWLVLAEETRTALGHGAAELLALVEGERDQHFAAAMQVAAKLRGRLMGEWLAGTQRKNGQRRGGQPKGGQRKSGQPKVGQG